MKHELEELEEFIYACVNLYKSGPPETFIPEFTSKEGFIALKVPRDMLTHITTNLSATEIEGFYGNRVRSRLRE